MSGEHRETDADTDTRLDLPAWSAFVDGEMSEAQRAEFGARLEHDEQARARVAAWRAQKAALKALSGAPDEAGGVFVLRSRRPSVRQRMALAAAWLALGIALGTTLGVFVPSVLRERVDAPAFARRAALAYAVYTPEVRHPVEVRANEEAHLASWLSKRLEHPLSVPSLAEYGYHLVGGRLLPGETAPAAQFMYESREGARLTLYMTRTSAVRHGLGNAVSFNVFGDGSRQTYYWVGEQLGYALSGPVTEGRLRAIAAELCNTTGGKAESWQ